MRILLARLKQGQQRQSRQVRCHHLKTCTPKETRPGTDTCRVGRAFAGCITVEEQIDDVVSIRGGILCRLCKSSDNSRKKIISSENSRNQPNNQIEKQAVDLNRQLFKADTQ